MKTLAIKMAEMLMVVVLVSGLVGCTDDQINRALTIAEKYVNGMDTSIDYPIDEDWGWEDCDDYQDSSNSKSPSYSYLW